MYAPDVQLDVYKWLVNNRDTAQRIMALATSHMADERAAYAMLVTTLEYAETFHVEGDWSQYLTAATHDLRDVDPHPVLHQTDMMAPKGFALFERPVYYLMNPNDRADMGTDYAPIRAIAWTTAGGITRPVWKDGPGPPLPPEEQAKLGAIREAERHIVWEEGKGAWLWMFVDTHWLHKMGEKWNKELGMLPPVALTGFDMSAWSFGMEWREIDRYEDRPPFTVDPSATGFRQMMYAFWHLTAQYVSTVVPNRALRRRWMREFPKRPPEHLTIRHVTLRRSHNRASSDGAAEGFEYSHRFKVRGHWRNQYYPSLGTHKTIWIDPFIKGPEDKPLIVKRSVFDVKR